MHPPTQGVTSQSKWGSPPVYSSSPGKGAMVLQGLRAKGSRHVGWRTSVHMQCTHVPGLGSEGQRLHEDLVHDGRRGHQVLQLEVEDTL